MPRASILAAVGLSLAACGDKPAVPAGSPAGSSTGSPIDSSAFAASLGVDLKAMTKTASGLYYRDLTVGDGPVVAAGQTVAVHYAGSLPNGTQFDANGPGDPPFTFRPGQGEVIPGWDEGVVGMRVGGRRQLVIPPALGYGAAGAGPIPPNAILVFTVEVVSAQ